MKKLSSVNILGGLTVDQATTLSGTVSIGGIGTGAYASVMVRSSSNELLYRNYADFVSDITSSIDLSNYVPISRTLTINGTTYDLSANRSWTIANNYISNVALANNALTFTGVGAGFNGTVSLDPVLGEIKTVYEKVKNVSGATVFKGTPLAVVPGQTSGNVSDVIPADAADPAKMPAIYIANEDILDQAEGQAILFGLLQGVDTSLYPSGTTVYVAAGGGWTATKPVHPDKIQNLGVITKQHPSNGSGVVTGVGRANDLPNLTPGKIWVGSSTYPIESTTVHVDEANGRVGIGTSTPSYKIDVQGTTLANSSVSVQGAFNINPLAAPPAIGGFTLSAGTNLGVGQYYYFVTYVTAIGETNASSVLSVVTTIGNTTVNLTGIPVSSDPRVIARNIYRTRVGQTSDAQRFLATISNNTATTYTDSATDASLTGVALQAYKVNTTARYFTVSGTQGMVIDGNLTALGRNAGNAIIASRGAAVRTVLIGASAGQNITTGQSNVIVGVAGLNITAGGSNTLMGDLAGLNINTGSGNTIIGSQAGRFLTTGYKNTIIGYEPARYLADGTTQFTTGFNNTILGGSIRMFAANDSNSIVIGNDARGLGSNTTVIGNSSITFTSIPAGNMTIGGTVNAGYKLDVQGTLRTINDAYFATTSGNVGIGTTSPSYKLDVKSGASNSYFTSFTPSAGSGFIRMYQDSNNHLSIYGANAAGTTSIVLNTNGVSYFKGGNIIIGGSADNGYRLQVNGSTFIQGSGTTSATTTLRIENANASSSLVVLDNGYVGIGTNTPTSRLQVSFPSDTFNQSIFRSDAGDNLLAINTFPTTNRMQLLLGSYNGTSTPTLASISDTDTGIQLSGNNIIKFVNGGSENVTINASGNVGIGTITPSFPLDVVADSSTNTAKFRVRSSNDYGNIRFTSYDGTETLGAINYQRESVSNGNLKLYTALNGNNSERLRITPSGNVGIGTTTPTSRLQVKGSGTTDATTSFLLEDSSGTERFKVLDSGKVSTLGFYSYPESGSIVIGQNTTSYLSHYTTTINGSLGITGLSGNTLNIGSPFDTSSFREGPAILYEGRNLEIGSWDNSIFSTSIRFNHINNTPESDTIEFKVGGNLTTTPSMIISASGNVGIGTTTPSYTLDVSGLGRFTGGINIGSQAQNISPRLFSVNTSPTLPDPSGRNLTFYSYNTNITNTINVGAFNFNGEIVNLTSGHYNNIRASRTFTPSSGNGSYNSIYLQDIINQTGGANGITRGLFISPTLTSAADFRAIETAAGNIIFNGGNVGIGTTSPSYKLQVNADEAGLYVRGASIAPYTQTIASFVYGGNGNSINIENQSGKASIQARAAGSTMDLLLNPVSGNVGIGTGSPVAKLDVSGDVNVGAGSGLSKLTVGSGAGYTGIILKNDSAFYNFLLGSQYNVSNAFEITPSTTVGGSTFSTPAFTVLATGNVGIGTTSPQKRLEVISGGNNFVSVGVQSLGVGQWAGIHFGYRESNTSYRKSAIVFERTDLTANDAQGKIHILNGPQGSAGSATLADAKLTIAENGNVGIGTTSPSAKLEVSGTIRAGVAGNSSANIPALLVTSSGTGDAQAAIAIQQATSEGDTIIFADYEPYVEWGISTENAANRIQFTGGTSTGSLGSKTLYNNAGNARTAHIKFDHDLASGQTLIGGNVGIGTTSPSTKLDVVGVITATGGNSTQWNTAYSWGDHSIAGYATQTYVNTAISNLVDSAPTTLDTLNELAAALGDDPNFATTVTNSIASKVPQTRTLTINGTAYDLSADRSWTITAVSTTQTAADSGKVTTVIGTGLTTVATIATASYDSARFEYTVKSGTNLRTGTVMAVWDGTNVTFTETSTPDVGNTGDITFTVVLAGGNANLTANSALGGWTVKVVPYGI